MSAIILPDKWRRQPPGHAKLDHSNYFGNLAVAAFLPGEPSPWAGTYGREPRPQGVFASFDGSTNGTVVQKSINAYPFSYVAQAYVSNLTATNTIIGMGSATAHTYALLDLSGTEAGDPFRLIIGAGATNSKLYKFSSSGHTSVVRTFVCVFESATVFRLYIGGAEVSNTATAGNGLQGLANLTHFGVGSYKSDAGDYTNKLTGGASVGAMFPVGFDASMAREISRNPWQMFRRVPQVLYFNAGGGATISGALESISLSTFGATVSTDRAVAAALESLTLTSNAATVSTDRAVTAAVESITISTSAATVSSDRAIASAVENIALTANPASVALGSNIGAATEAVSLTTNAATVAMDASVAATLEAITITGLSATVQAGSDNNISAALESITVTINPATVSRDSALAAALESISVTPHQASIAVGSVIGAALESLTLTTYPAGLALDVAVSAQLEQINLATFAAVVGLGSNVSALTEAITLTPHGATLALSAAISGALEQITLTTLAAVVAGTEGELGAPGLEFTIPLSRLGYTIPLSRVHFTIREG